MEKNSMKILLCGIYQIRNLMHNTVYIGQSSDLNARRYKHFYDLQKGIHENSHLQRSFNKYGKDNFVFEIVILCEQNELDFYEQNLVSRTSNVYNVNKENVKTSR